MSITQFIVKLTSFIYCGSIYLFLGTYLDFCEYPSEGLNYNSDINNVRMWIILFLY